MELAFLVYVASMLNDVRHLFLILLGVILAITGTTVLFIIAELQENPLSNKYVIKGSVVSAVLALLLVLTPTERTAWYMVGAYIGQSTYTEVVNSDVAQDLKQIVRNKIKEYAEEGAKKK